MARTLLTPSNPKTDKARALGYSTAVLHLAPATLAGGRTVCPWSTAGCREACLNTAGRGGIIKRGETSNAIQRARVARTRWFQDDRPAFLARLGHELRLHIKRAARDGLRVAIRLNATSDIPWETVAPSLFAAFPSVQFYDYTKGAARALRAAHRASGVWTKSTGHAWPQNYDLTLSWSGENRDECERVISAGGRVAVPARNWSEGAPVWPDGPEGGQLASAPAVNGDEHDLTFTHGRGVVLALRPKGPARRDRTGFVVDAGEASPI